MGTATDSKKVREYMIKRILITLLVCITCIETTCFSGDIGNSIHYLASKASNNTATFLRDKLFAGEKYIEYECYYEFGESPFYIKIQEAYSGEFILYLKFLKEPKNVSENKYLLKYDGNKFSTNNKDPFFDFYPKQICGLLCLPVAYILKNMNESNGMVIKILENQKTAAYAIYAKSELLTFIQEGDKMEYYGGYSEGITSILPISFTRKNVYDEKDFMSSADKFIFTKNISEKLCEQKVDMMSIWIKAMEKSEISFQKIGIFTPAE